ncbi:hypothetical protein ACFQY0_09730 [Haloferula chungangensis]|uniref:Uncharacterized protein n=1 Tax=Haloferula chungangensis TaxID=1048331 RepID=A0ABW2L512_9BACT
MEIPSWRIVLALLPLPVALMASDIDGDGIPDDWEDNHHMDKSNPNDASVDFDRDGLDAFKEYVLDSSGAGEGPIGNWSSNLINLDFMNRIDSSFNRKEIVDFNDRGDLLVNVRSWTYAPGLVPTYYYRVWFYNGSEGTWSVLSTVDGREPSLLKAHDLNNEGVIVGEARSAASNGGDPFGFIKDMRKATCTGDVSPYLTPFSESLETLVGINDFGEVIGVDAAGDPYFETLSGGTVSCPPSWTSPVFTAINNWGEVAGVEYGDYWGIGAPRHFLMTPGWSWLTDFPAFDNKLLDLESSEIEELFDASFRPTWLNDWGEFGGHYWIETQDDW